MCYYCRIGGETMIQSIHEAGFSPLIYDVSFFVSLLIATIAAFFFAKRLKIKRGTAVLCVPFVWLFSYLCVCLVMYAETDFSIFDCGYNIKCFVFIPVAIWVFSRVFKLPFTFTSDLIAPLFCIQHGIANIGCIFYGCCYGYPSEGGIYSPLTRDLRFPVQVVEMLFSFFVATVIFIVIRKKLYNTGGVALFLSLAIFAVGRFFIEFMKDSNGHILGFLHPLQLHMLFLLTVCLISLAYIYALNKEKEAKQHTKKEK